MLRAEEVTVRFGERVALAGATLEVARDEVVAPAPAGPARARSCG